MSRPRPVARWVAFLLLASAAVVAATVWRWVDERGRVQYSQTVPERYRSTAKPVDVTANQPSAEQQREALERAQREKARAAAAATATDPGRQPASATAPATPGSPPTAKRPAQVPDEQTDCETWQRLYLESAECFGPYRTVRGGIKPEAFDACNVVSEPPPRCKLRVQ